MDQKSKYYSFWESGNSLRFRFSYETEWLRVFPVVVGSPFYLLVFGSIMFFPFLQAIIEGPLEDLNPFFYCSAPIFLIIALFSLVEVLWQLAGKEIINIDEENIFMRHQIFGWGTWMTNKKFNSDQIAGIFLNQRNSCSFFDLFSRRSEFFSFERGKIEIHFRTVYGSLQVYRFGSVLSDKEAEQVFNFIRGKFPEYKYGLIRRQN